MKTPHPHLTDTKNEPVAFQIVKGELRYKSKADDQSFGMWCPVNYDTEHEHEEGTKFYTAPQPQFTSEQLQSVMDALLLADKDLCNYEHSVGGGDDEINIEPTILTVRAAIALLKGMK